MSTERLESSFRVAATSYILLLVGFAVSFILAHDITKKESLSMEPVYAVFYAIICLTSTGCLIYIDIYLDLKLRKLAPPDTRNAELSADARKTMRPLTEKGGVDRTASGNDVPSIDDTKRQCSSSSRIVPTTQEVKGRYVNDTKGINFYFLVGGLGFGVGAISLNVITLATIHPDCINAYVILVAASHLVLAITEIIFVVRRHNAVILRGNKICRFAIVHVIATNICLWVMLSVGEALEFYIHEYKHTNVTEHGVCLTKKLIRVQASAYLVPCLIEHSLFVIPVLYSIYTQMTIGNIHVTYKATKRTLRKLWLVARRVHIGFFVIIITVLAQTAFFYIVDNLKHEERIAQIIFHITQLILLLLTIAALGVSFREFKKLGYHAEKPMTFDECLLLMSLGGYLLFNVTRLVPSITGLETKHVEMSIMVFFNSLLSLVHGILQTVFITIGMRTHAKTDVHETKKPGRSAIGFLLVSNLSLWFTLTFEIRQSTVALMYTSFYGQLPWLLVTFCCIPLVIFYLFHSTVCFSDIWKEAYESRPQECDETAAIKEDEQTL